MKKYFILLLPVILFLLYALYGYQRMQEKITYPPEYENYVLDAYAIVDKDPFFLAYYKLTDIKVYQNDPNDKDCQVYTAYFKLYDIFGLPGGYRIFTQNCNNSMSLQSGNYHQINFLFWGGMIYTIGFLIYSVCYFRKPR